MVSVLQMSFQAAMLIIAIANVRALALNKLPKTTFLLLWGVVLCRLLIPFSIPSQFSLPSMVLRGGYALPLSTAAPQSVISTGKIDTTLQETVNAVAQPIHAQQSSMPLEMNASSWTIIWLIGMVVAIALFALSHIKSMRVLRCALPIKNTPFITDWLNHRHGKRRIRILYSDQILTPVTIGVFKPHIILTKTLNLSDTTMLSCVLAHEHCHIKRFDMIWKALMVSALCVHWFNPLVWLMFIMVNRDLELTCDEQVIRQMGMSNKKEYAYALINMAQQRERLSPLYIGFSKNAIEERITAIMKIKKTTVSGILAACLLFISITVVLATSESTTLDRSVEQTQPKMTFEVSEHQTYGQPHGDNTLAYSLFITHPNSSIQLMGSYETYDEFVQNVAIYCNRQVQMGQIEASDGADLLKEVQKLSAGGRITINAGFAKDIYPHEAAIKPIIALKTDDYKNQPLKEFNQTVIDAITQNSNLLENHTEILSARSKNNEAHDFADTTLRYSIEESISPVFDRTPGFVATTSKGTDTHAIIVTYAIEYKVLNPDTITVAQRDNAIQTLRYKLDSVVSEARAVVFHDMDEMQRRFTNTANKFSNNVVEFKSATIRSIEFERVDLGWKGAS